jgi:chromate transporter
MAIIALGAAVGWLWLNGERKPSAVHRTSEPSGGSGPPAQPEILCLVSFFVLLLGLPVLAHLTANPWLEIFDRFYRAGAMVFGGGHVILPLLEREVVAPGWLTHDQFLAGYGAAQAVPGPLFTLSAYLGAVMNHGPGGWLGGAWALLAIFSPALLLVAGVLPFWQNLRHQPQAQAALRGANATVVGVLLAAFYNPVWIAGIVSGRSLGLAVAAFVALQFRKVPVWSVILALTALGHWLL